MLWASIYALVSALLSYIVLILAAESSSTSPAPDEILPNTYSVNPENTQRLGWGIDLTLRSKLNNKWSTYGFFRSWNIEDSDVVSCSALIYCYEPKNQTNEIGAGISYHF